MDAGRNVTVRWLSRFMLSNELEVSAEDFEMALAEVAASSFAFALDLPKDVIVAGPAPLPAYLEGYPRPMEVNYYASLEMFMRTDLVDPLVVSEGLALKLRNAYLDILTLTQPGSERGSSLGRIFRIVLAQNWRDYEEDLPERGWASTALVDFQVRQTSLTCDSSVEAMCSRMRLDLKAMNDHDHDQLLAASGSSYDGYGVRQNQVDDGLKLPQAGVGTVIFALFIFSLPICFSRSCRRTWRKLCAMFHLPAPPPTPSSQRPAPVATPARELSLQGSVSMESMESLAISMSMQSTRQEISSEAVQVDPPTTVPSITVQIKEEETCCICLVEFVHLDKCAVMPCGAHRLHWRCWASWYHRSARCPECRCTATLEEVLPGTMMRDENPRERSDPSSPEGQERGERASSAPDLDRKGSKRSERSVASTRSVSSTLDTENSRRTPRSSRSSSRSNPSSHRRPRRRSHSADHLAQLSDDHGGAPATAQALEATSRSSGSTGRRSKASSRRRRSERSEQSDLNPEECLAI